MNNKNKNYRVMKFLEPVNKTDKAKGYVRMDIRGVRGTIMVTVENVGDNKSTSEVYLFRDKNDKIKVGTVNSKKGMIKKNMSVGNYSSPIEKYNVCGIVRDNKIVLYAPLFSEVNPSEIRKLESVVQAESFEGEYIEQQGEIIEVNDHTEVKEISENQIIENQKDLEESETIDESICQLNEDDEYNNSNEQKYKTTTVDEEEEITDCEIPKIESQVETQTEKNDEQATVDDVEQVNEYDDMEQIKHTKQEHSSNNKTAKTKYRNSFEESIYNVLNGYEKISPLSVEINDLSWWKITSDDRGNTRGLLPYYNQIISSYYPYPMASRVTTCHALMRKYGYYIFGVYKEKGNISRLVYGVPGEFRRDEQPYKGTTGFKNWSYKNKELDGEHGFWLAFVDAKTGDITEPPQIDLG